MQETKNKEIMKELEKNIVRSKKGQNKVWGWIKENISKLILIPIALFYILYGIFALTRKDADILEIVGSIALGLFTGTIMYINLMRAGIQDGKKSDEYKAKEKEHTKVSEDIVEYQDKLPAYCNFKQRQELENERVAILQNAMLDYKAWQYGYYKNRMDLTPVQLEALERVKNIKIDPIKPSDLLTKDNRRNKTKYGRYGRNSGDYIRGKSFISILTTVAMAIVFGYYALEPVIMNKDTISKLVWNTLQIILWLSFGFIKYVDAKTFIIDEYSENNIVVKTSYLKEFLAIIKTNPNLLDEYEDPKDKEIREFIKRKEEEQNG